jgi:hypothetical protein
MTEFVHTPAEVLPLVDRFKASITGQDPVSRVIRGRAELLHAELLIEMAQVSVGTKMQGETDGIAWRRVWQVGNWFTCGRKRR